MNSVAEINCHQSLADTTYIISTSIFVTNTDFSNAQIKSMKLQFSRNQQPKMRRFKLLHARRRTAIKTRAVVYFLHVIQQHLCSFKALHIVSSHYLFQARSSSSQTSLSPPWGAWVY